MNKDSTKFALMLILIGCALFLLASPFGDWLGKRFQAPSEPTETLAAAKKSAAPLPVLRVHKDTLLKAPSPDTGEEPQLPPQKAVAGTATLENEEIEQTMSRHQNLFQRCWTQRLKETPNLTGKVLMQFEISPRGKTQNVQVAETDIKDDPMLQCLTSVVERIQFHEFKGGGIVLTFPLSFE